MEDERTFSSSLALFVIAVCGALWLLAALGLLV